MRHTFNLVEVYCLDIRFLSARQCHIPHLSPSRPILIDQLRVCFCSVLGRNSQCQGMYTFNKEVEGQKLLAPAVPTADDGGVTADESRRRKENPFNFKCGCCHRLYDTKYDISYIYIVY